MENRNNVNVSQIMEEIRDSITLPSKAYFFDTTLRDGEQTPGISFTYKEKLSIAQALNEMKIDVIEAGFPVTSKGDFEACKAISKLGLNS
ncbi:MAG: 2-isopropylmalate synthase, partial [Promethearchaeota archaeon]